MRRLFTLALVLAASSCTCRNDIGTVTPGFRIAAETQSLDFGRVLEGKSATLPMSLSAETRAAVTVTTTVAAPFSVQASVDIEGGGQASVPVTFHAGNGLASSEVVLQANGQELRVAVKGVGVRAPVCVPSGPCQLSTYLLEQDACVETVKPNDSECEPNSVCLEKGRCRNGECLGTSRSCDDADLCTNDACDLRSGCVNTMKACPPLSNPCHVPVCDSKKGCLEVDAPDLTPCGPVTCVTVNICMSGSCTTLPTPDGVECGPAVACLGEGHCHNQKCERADAGPWLPAWTATLNGSPVGDRPSLLSGANGVFFEVCGLLVDAGVADAGLADDGGFDDGGFDAGPVVVLRGPCGLGSFTRTGFERFTSVFRDGQRRRLVHVSSAGVVMLVDGGLEWRSPNTGELVNVLPTPLGVASTRSVAARRDGTVLVALPEDDGGARVVAWSDAGVQLLAQPGFSVKIIAIDELNGLLGYDPATGTVLLQGDAGVLRLDGGGAANSLVTAAGISMAGVSHLLRSLDDGGVELVSLQWSSDAGEALMPDERSVLMGLGTGTVTYRRCVQPMMSCLDADKATYLRRFDALTGAFMSEVQLLPRGVAATLEESALLGLVPGSVAIFVHGELDAGAVNAGLAILVEGQPPAFCPLPQRVVSVRGALFSGTRMFVLDDRGPGAAVLQAYELNALPLLGSDWASADGLGATRRAGP